MEQLIYFDNAATTPIRDEVFEAMLPYLKENFANPSSVYGVARQNRSSIDKAREQVANALGADIKEIYFTGSGTEADNWAIMGIAQANEKKGKHIITSQIEHHAVLKVCEYLEKQGFQVTYLPVDQHGLISIEDLEKAIRPDTILISVMYANNEIGTVQPIKEIGEIAKKHGIIFHTDAVQAVGHIPINVKEQNIDLLSLSAHKIYGPKGVGVLYIRKGVKINKLIHGGGQENKKRGGTENVAGIVGLGTAIDLACKEMHHEVQQQARLRNKLINGLLEKIPNARLNGHPERRLPGNVNISFEFIEGESLLLLLDMKNIAASSGSACTSGSLDPSHVLLAIGLPHEKAHGSLRLSLGRYNTEAEVDFVINELPAMVNRLREMSPLYEDYLNSCKTCNSCQ